MDTKAIVTDLKEVLKRHKLEGSVEVQEYNIFDGYYEKHRNIFNSSECWYENVESDRMKTLVSDRDEEFLTDVTMDDCGLTDVIFGFFDTPDAAAAMKRIDDAGEPVAPAGLTLDDLRKLLTKEEYSAMKDAIWEDIANNWDWDEAVASGLFNEDSMIEHTDVIEALAYHVVYFEPRTFDEDVAHECHLVPFLWRPPEGEDLDLLALGGCGMDMSPRLDAYQALVDGTLPSNSMLLSEINRNYCESLIGKATMEKALQAARLERPAIVLRTY